MWVYTDINKHVDKWINGEGLALTSQKISINNRRRNEGNRKSSLEHQSNKCCMQDPQTDTKISGCKFKKKQNIYVVSNYLFPNPPAKNYKLQR